MARIQRHKISTFASGMEAVLHIHEIVGTAGAGLTVGISAAIHGNEGTGSQVILDLARRIDPAKVRGRILLLPVANPPAFEANLRNSPIDHLNLNRHFPGDTGGWFSEQLAAVMVKQFLKKIDVLIDIHAGGALPTVDYIYIRNDEAMSRAFGSKLLYRAKPGIGGTVYEGTAAGIADSNGAKSMVVELGGGVLDQAPYVQRCLGGVENVLRHLKVLGGKPKPPPSEQIVMAGIDIIRPTMGGWLENAAPPLGEKVAAGAVLGRVVSPYTFETLETIRNTGKAGWMVLAHLSRNLVQPGEYGYMIGR